MDIAEMSEIPITLVLAEEEQAILSKCVDLLDNERSISVLGSASTEMAVISAVEQIQPSIVVLGVSLGNDQNLGLMQLLLDRVPKLRVLLLADDDQYNVLHALTCGAGGVLRHSELDIWFVKAIKKVSDGEPWISRKQAFQVVEHLRGLSGASAYN
jgi:DNA-binding NarL/FixJ family response regulator